MVNASVKIPYLSKARGWFVMPDKYTLTLCLLLRIDGTDDEVRVSYTWIAR